MKTQRLLAIAVATAISTPVVADSIRGGGLTWENPCEAQPKLRLDLSNLPARDDFKSDDWVVLYDAANDQHYRIPIMRIVGGQE